MFVLLVKVRIRSLWNVAAHSFARRPAFCVFLTLLGICVFSGIFVGFRFFLHLAPTARQTQELIYHIFYFLFLFLLAGSVPFVASTLLQASDYALLSAAPIRPHVIVAAKLLDATVTNSLQFALIGLPAIAACALSLNLPPIGLVLVPVIVALFICMPALFTALLLLAALQLFGMRRLRSAIAAVNGIMAALVCLTIVSHTGEIHFSQTGMNAIGASVTSSPLSVQLGPSAPFAWMMVELAQGNTPEALKELLLTLVLMTVLFIACLRWGGGLLSASALAQDEAGQLSAQSGRAIRGSRSGPFAVFSPSVAALVAKDLKYVARDSVLLSQLAMPVVLFLVPFVLALQQDSRHLSNAAFEIYPFSVAMTVLILFMQTSILSLSSIGLESRSFWLLLGSPITGRTILWSKFVMSSAISGGVATILTVLASVAFQASLAVTLIQIGFVTLAAVALCGIGVGISAAFPRFVYENPAHRVSVWALVLGFLASMTYVISVGVLAVVAWQTATIVEDSTVLIYSIAGAILAALTLVAILAPMIIGARRLSVYQWEH